MAGLFQGGAPPTRADFHDAIERRSDCWFAACVKITRNPDLAEDALQDALLNAWRKREQFDGQSSLETWIHRIAVNAALGLLRKQRPLAFEPLPDEMPDDAPTPEQNRHTCELDDALGAALLRLSDAERICFVLKHVEQWRLAEIASELDTNVGVVKQALFRGIRKLRPLMSTLERTAS